MPSEFDIIEQYFSRNNTDHSSVHLSIGDDAAITSVPTGMQQVIAIDTLVENIHFKKETSAYNIAYKALAVNLSDLAAMGAKPCWFTLALTLPDINTAWLADFSKGLFTLADQYNMQLIGGDTTRGPLAVTIQIAGHIPQGKALLRSGAKAGDYIYVTGNIGDGRAGLAAQEADLHDSDAEYLVQRLQQPTPRVNTGESLIGMASACIDVSDGLVADLSHILQASGVGASIDLDKMPLSLACEHKRELFNLSCLQLAQSGDDYELCFTVPEKNISMLACTCDELGVEVTQLGQVEKDIGLRCYEKGNLLDISQAGYQHFYP